MDIFDVLSLIGGLSLFLFGMNVMGQSLERRAGGKLRTLLGKMTTNKAAGLFTGLGVTAVIQSSSATTVMVVGFVNSGLMTLKQAINVIMGANIGTTVTAWIFSLAGIDGKNIFVSLLKPSSFTPVLAFIGIIFYMFCKKEKKKDTGMIFLGFATLMFGMETMSDSVAGLCNVPEFTKLFIMFKNPVLGVLAGAVFTAVIQSSSASVGILQALAVTGQISYGAAVPIIMGQNIGTCITAMISSVGTNKNAKRAAMVHLGFNVIGTAVWLAVFCIIQAIFTPVLLERSADLFGIAAVHSVFNLLCTLLMLPLSGLIERLVCRIVPDSKTPEKDSELDERLLATPSIALERSYVAASEMAECSVKAFKASMSALTDLDPDIAQQVREAESVSDHYEDIIGTYLVKLSTHQISSKDSNEAAKLLKTIGDFERISDHAVNVIESAEELKAKGLSFSKTAAKELSVLTAAVDEILDIVLKAFLNNDIHAAEQVEPLEQVIDDLKEKLRMNHILRMQQQKCSIEIGFVWSDLLTNLERVSDHCSNIAGCMIDMNMGNLNLHESLREMKGDKEKYIDIYKAYTQKYIV